VAALLACFLLGITLIVVGRVTGTKGFVVLSRRWAEQLRFCVRCAWNGCEGVERTFDWLGRCRRLSKGYEHIPDVSEAIVTLARIRLMPHRLVHPNRKRLPAP